MWGYETSRIIPHPRDHLVLSMLLASWFVSQCILTIGIHVGRLSRKCKHYEKNCSLNSVKTNLNHKFSQKMTELAMKKFSECGGWKSQPLVGGWRKTGAYVGCSSDPGKIIPMPLKLVPGTGKSWGGWGSNVQTKNGSDRHGPLPHAGLEDFQACHI